FLDTGTLILMCLEESLESTQERIADLGEAMEDFKRKRRKLDYRIQQHSKDSSEGSCIIPDVLDEPKDNSGSSSSSLYGSDDEVQDVSSDEKNKVNESKADAKVVEKQAGDEDPVVERTLLIDTIISMVTEKLTPTPIPPTTQAQVTNVSESDSSSKFEQRLPELEKKVEAMLERSNGTNV
ncbi:hypothetical protein Tco_0809169, partial [Tanacetum coccineum]